MRSSISLVRSDGVPDAGIARYFSAILETVGKLGNVGKLGELADGSVFFRIRFFTIVVSAIHVIQRAILYATVKSLYFKTPNTHAKTDIASFYPTGVVLLNKGSIQNTLWDVACGLCNWHSIILIIMSVIIAV